MNVETLFAAVRYDPITGAFHSLATGREMGGWSIGYRYLTIRGERALAHRAAWAFLTGTWPTQEIDHINGVRDDNRAVNLREASHRDNIRNRKRNANNSSGFKGVSLHRETGKWRARIKVDTAYRSLGLHDTPEAAHAAYCAAARMHFGEFARSA